MTFTDYLVNGLLIGLVLLQIRGRRITTRALILPVAIVAYVAFEYIKGIPTHGNDLVLVALGAGAGLLFGTGAGLTTEVYERNGAPFAKATAVAAVLWVLGVGSRLAFELYTSHGGQAAVGRFSAAHQITSANAWVDCLVLMALVEVVSRTSVIALKYRRIRQSIPASGQASGQAGGQAPAPAARPGSMMEAGGHLS